MSTEIDSVQETPVKRRKVNDGDVSQTKTYDSGDDSGDMLFDEYETVATVPLPSQDIKSSDYATQPTQLLEEVGAPHMSHQSPSTVQVKGSSPAPVRPKSPPPKKALSAGQFAGMIAPLGTAYRQPLGTVKAPPAAAKPNAVYEISSDEDELARYRQHSPDEDAQSASIKPTVFKSRSANPSASGFDRFKYHPGQPRPGAKAQASTLQGSVFGSRNRDEGIISSKLPPPATSSDIMANAYGGKRSNRPVTVSHQSGPAKALPVVDMSINDVPDAGWRVKISEMREVVPLTSIRTCYLALQKKRGNKEDALDLVADQEDRPLEVNLISEGEKPDSSSLSNDPLPSPKKIPAKQQLKAPVQKIQDKWGEKQRLLSQFRDDSQKASEKPKPRRRLVQGRKNESSPAASPAASPQVKSARRVSVASDASDSAVGTEFDEQGLEPELLKFFNDCRLEELLEVAATTIENARSIISKRPFKGLSDVKDVAGPASAPAGKKKPTKKPIGEKIVDKCWDMFVGYRAIDELAKKCEALGAPLKEEMRSWGVNESNYSKDGETELAELEIVSNVTRDSGIGTPSSRAVSVIEEDLDLDTKRNKVTRKGTFFQQPSIMAANVSLKDYQTIGINWLSLLFDRQLSGILADDMGLGKTCQVISFLAHLKERKSVNGLHLVIVPASTLENWLREFEQFCPTLNVMPYYAGQNERPAIQLQIESSLDSLNVLVTTYTMAKSKDDNKFLRRLEPVCVVYDEGHILRNSNSLQYRMYMRIKCQMRVLLTGTPLQNNLGELASLLGFIMPSLFEEHREDLEAIFSHKAKTNDGEESHAALLSRERIQRAKRMMAPFVLRRKKHQVLKHLPRKHCRVQYCEMSESQVEIYGRERSRALKVIEARQTGEKVGNDTSHVMMALRKASIHPLLFRRLYNEKILRKMSKACIKEDQFRESDPELVYQDMEVMTDFELFRFCTSHPKTMAPYSLKNDEWMDSGKITVLSELLKQYKANGDRCLVFSQFVMVLDILEPVLETLGMQFFRLDGSTKIDERQDMLDQFYREPDITVFLLSTGAGGAGINLACANKVVIFDSSFNPQADIQAENRAHRVGQTREVEVVRLVTRGTIEEQILKLGETKLELDERVAGGDVDRNNDGKKVEGRGAKLVADMMLAERQTMTEDRSASGGASMKESEKQGDNSQEEKGLPANACA